MRELTVAASVVRALMELAVSKGASRAALAERSRIACAELEDADNRIPFSRYRRADARGTGAVQRSRARASLRGGSRGLRDLDHARGGRGHEPRRCRHAGEPVRGSCCRGGDRMVRAIASGSVASTVSSGWSMRAGTRMPFRSSPSRRSREWCARRADSRATDNSSRRCMSRMRSHRTAPSMSGSFACR